MAPPTSRGWSASYALWTIVDNACVSDRLRGRSDGRFAREDAIAVLDSAAFDVQASFPVLDTNVLAAYKFSVETI